MLRQTFCHLAGVGLKTERSLWRAGLRCWDDLSKTSAVRLAPRKLASLRARLDPSFEHLARGRVSFFAGALAPGEHWRLFQEFRDTVAYLDIETTGLGARGDHITTIALYGGGTIRHYVYGDNLDEFKRDVREFDLLVSYNGKCFDVPWLEEAFGIRLDQAHIDLRFVLRSLGYSGGLKGCERQLGLDRGELDGIDGFMAVLLWDEFERGKDSRVLETLLAYNVEDVLSLETLMVLAYNAKLRDTPFHGALSLPGARPPENPFCPHRPTIERLRRFR